MGNFRLKILPPAQKISDYFMRQPSNTKYIFPICIVPFYHAWNWNAKKQALIIYNMQLKYIAQICKIKKPISSYVPRHSFANCLKQKGIPTDIISESLGQQNMAITRTHIKELDYIMVDNAMEELLS